VIVLTQEVSASLLILDDHKARRIAISQGLIARVTGTAGILPIAKVAAVIPQVQPVLDDLIRIGFRISKKLYQQILQQAGE
jgi:predicted nucleic acid-binding protein